MTFSPLRLAIIGCGAITEQGHLPAAAGVADARLTALVDQNLPRAQALAAKHPGVQAASDFRPLIGAIDAVQPAKGRRALVLLSDGDDKYSSASADAALERARRADVMVYPIALGRRRPELFAELATLTGGRSFHARDAKGLGDTLRAVARDLRHQYLLGYTPSRPIQQGSGGWRGITVTVKRPGSRVRARDGYVVR